MYVSVPKNYSGMAFSHEKEVKVPQTLPILPHPKVDEKCEKECEKCTVKEKNPLSCLLEAFRFREKGGFDTEDFLLIGLIVLLLGKEGNEDVVLVLAMLLLRVLCNSDCVLKLHVLEQKEIAS